MDPRIAKAMMRDPRKLMEFQMTGRTPRLTDAPSTPLRDLIEQIPPRLRARFTGVKLHPELGFRSNMQFHTLEQLYRWLGGNEKLVGSQTMPYMSYMDRGFRKRLTLPDIIKHCAASPELEELHRCTPKSIH